MTHPGTGTATPGAGFLNPGRLIRFGACVAFGMVAAFVLFLATADGVEAMAGGRLGGDWAAFYVAGELARVAPELVLDGSAQAAAQAQYLEGEFAPFPYPPLLAYVFTPLSLLSFRTSYAVYVVVLTAIGAAGTLATMDVLRVRSPMWRLVGMLGAMTYAPTFLSVGGAQNATVTLFAVATGARLLQRDRQVWAGLAFGLLWFKPQFAVPVLGLLLVSGRWTPAGLTALLPGAALWAASAVVLGVDWVQVWWREIISITDAGNKTFNTQASVSAVEYLRGRLSGEVAEVVGVGVALLLGVLFVVLVRRRGDDPAVLLALVCSSVLLTALHALPYELVLLIPVIGLGLVSMGRTGVGPGVAAYMASWLLLLPVHPLLRFTYVVAVSWGALWAAETNAGQALRGPRRRGARRPVSP